MITAFFPLLVGVLYGLSYVLIEKTLGTINVVTFNFLGGVVAIVLALIVWAVKGEAVSLQFISEKPISLIVLIFFSMALAQTAWILALYAVKDISAVYTAFGELSYPLFTVLFAFLILGVRHLDWTVIVGGVLTLIGSFILVYGQLKVKGA